MSSAKQAESINNREDDARWLLVSDVDNTLTGDDEALYRFIDLVTQTPGLIVGLNSSRPAASVRHTFAAFEWKADALITAMGTEVRIGGEEIVAWSQQFEPWDRRVVDREMAKLGFEAHPPELQTRFKASFSVPGERNQRRAMAAIEATGLPAQYVSSGESDFDVLPPGAGKGRATAFLARQLGVPLERTIVAGDSLNDLTMFQVTRHGIVVGNARQELRRALGDVPGVYEATATHAGGVIEGLTHWGVPLPRPSPTE